MVLMENDRIMSLRVEYSRKWCWNVGKCVCTCMKGYEGVYI